MNIYLVVTPFFPTADSFRGAFVYDQVQAIRRTGKYDRIVIFRPAPAWSVGSDYTYNGFSVHYFPVVQLPSNLLTGATMWLNRALFIRTLRNRGIAPSDIAVAHAHVSFHGSYALALKSLNPAIKTLLQHHDPDPYSINLSRRFAECRFNTRFNARYLQKVFSQIDLHVCISQKVAHNLQAFPRPGVEEIYPRYLELLPQVSDFSPTRLRATYILYNGVDTAGFYPGTPLDRKSVV